MIDFAWFYMFKFLVVAVLVFFIARPIYREWKEFGVVTPKGKKVPIFLAFVLGMLLVFNPLKIDNSTSAERMRQSYDPVATEQIEEIKKHNVTKYSPDSNEDDIKRILEN